MKKRSRRVVTARSGRTSLFEANLRLRESFRNVGCISKLESAFQYVKESPIEARSTARTSL